MLRLQSLMKERFSEFDKPLLLILAKLLGATEEDLENAATYYDKWEDVDLGDLWWFAKFYMNHADLSYDQYDNIVIEDITISDVNFSYTTWRRVTFDNCTFVRCNFTNANFIACVLANCIYTSCLMGGATYERCLTYEYER